MALLVEETTATVLPPPGTGTTPYRASRLQNYRHRSTYRTGTYKRALGGGGGVGPSLRWRRRAGPSPAGRHGQRQHSETPHKRSAIIISSLEVTPQRWRYAGARQRALNAAHAWLPMPVY